MRTNLYFLLLLCLSAASLQAQVFPVTLVAQSNPPHTGNLAELTAPGFNRLGASLILNDRNELSYQVRLVVEIEGQGIRLKTRADFQPRPITLSYGVPVQIRGADLAEYLDINNLDFQGITRQQYIQQGALPDGLYSVCFTAHAYARSDESAASGRSCTGIVAVRHDPPVLIAPIGMQTPIFPQNMAVQWQPRHVAGFPVEYTLQLFEFDPNGALTPDLLVQYTQPFVEKTINTVTATFLTPADPPLELGGRYLIRVRARDITMQNSFFNDGWSAPEFFTYGEACRAPENITAETVDESNIRVNWTPRPGFNRYVVRYRERDTPGANWYEDETLLAQHVITRLVDATAYEIQVQTLCNGEYEGPFSPSLYAVTDSVLFDASTFDCSSSDSLRLPANTEPIAMLNPGDIVRVGNFQMRLTEVEPAEATASAWQGVGQIRVSWLLGKRFICTFDNLMVNTGKEVYAGNVKAYSKGLESIPEWKSPADVLADITKNATPSLMDFCGRVDSTQLQSTLPDTSQTPPPPADTTQTPSPPADSTQQPPADPFAGVGDTEDQGALADPFEDYDDGSLPYNAGLNAGGSTFPVILGGSPHAIVIDKVEFTPYGATLNAYFSAAMPGSNKFVAFQAEGVRFHPGGLLGENRMQLVTEIKTVWSNKIQLTIQATESSYVSWDCRGFRGVSIDGRVEFCPNLLVALQPDSLTALPNENVTGTFIATMPRWGQFVADMSMTPFEIPRLRDWGWEVQNMVFDFSDEVTPASVTFPEGYSHPDVGEDLSGPENPRWTGFYLRTARVKVPKGFYGARGNAVQIGVTDIIIDQTGFTGNVYAENVLSAERGRMGNWAFSLDTLQFGLRHSQFHYLGFTGMVEVPAFSTPMKYGCLIQPDSAYLFSVGLGDDTLRMDAWKADVELYANTRIEIGYDVQRRTFLANAFLFGKASMKPTIGRATNPRDTLEVANLQFQNFVISTSAPYLVNIGTWQYSSGNQQFLSRFPLSIRNISLAPVPQDEDEAEEEEDDDEGPDITKMALGITAAVNLVGANDQGFSAEGSVRILFDVYLDTARMKQVWNYAGVRVDSFALDYVGAAFELKGRINFYEEDSIYGSGFRALIQAVFAPRLRVGAVAQFGRKGTYRYWFADALISFNPGVAMGTTGLGLYGFGGGASYKVRRQQFQNIILPDSTGFYAPDDMERQIGRSLSGTVYVPDSTAGIGIKAIVSVGTFPKPEVFNSDLTFEIIFNENWGVRSIGFNGNGRFLTPPPKPGETARQPAIRAILSMSYDFENSAFHADLDVYVNQTFLKGAYPNNLAGRGTIHTDPDDWYIYIGTPQRRIMLSYSLAGLANMAKPGGAAAAAAADSSSLVIDWANVGLLYTAYLDAGSILPPFPELPQRVQSILGGEYSLANRDDPRYASGGGVMFGASVELDIPDLTFLAFYASFSAGIGFDLMMRNYGLDARCAGNETSNSPIGINGWYASGQLWAYVEGSIGIKVNLFTVSGRFRILDLSVAAVLQTRLPNPFWARGVVGGRFRILNGLVSGNCRFSFEIGKKCDIVGGSELAGIEVIASTQPDGNTNSEVDVFARPQATFNIAMGQIFELQDDDGRPWEYRPKLHQFAVLELNAAGNTVIDTVRGEIIWNEANDIIGFKSDEVLNGNSKYRLVVRVRFDKKGRYENTWNELRKLSGTPEEQSVVVDFTTGAAPDFIPAHNIDFSYPLPDQFNFHKGQSNQGYIRLKRGQAYLFKGHPNWSYAAEANMWEQKIQFMNGNQALSTANFTYNSSTRQINFSIPGNALPAAAVLSMRLVNRPLVNDEALNANIAAIRTELLALQESEADTAFTEIILEERVAQTVQRGRKPKAFYTSFFRTSQFNTFQQKISALNMSANWFNPIFLDPNETSGATINDFGVFVTGSELFDLFDQSGYHNGDNQVAPLIRPEIDLGATPNNWYNNAVNPYMYQHFPAPAQGVTLSWRNPTVLGNVPVRAVWIEQDGDPHRLTEEQKQGGPAPVPQPLTSLAVKVPYHMLFDDFDYKHKVSNYAAINPNLPPAWVNFMQNTFPYAPFGTYRVLLRYFLPGSTTPAVQVPVNVFYGASN